MQLLEMSGKELRELLSVIVTELDSRNDAGMLAWLTEANKILPEGKIQKPENNKMVQIHFVAKNHEEKIKLLNIRPDPFNRAEIRQYIVTDEGERDTIIIISFLCGPSIFRFLLTDMADDSISISEFLEAREQQKND